MNGNYNSTYVNAHRYFSYTKKNAPLSGMTNTLTVVCLGIRRSKMQFLFLCLVFQKDDAWKMSHVDAKCRR